MSDRFIFIALRHDTNLPKHCHRLPIPSYTGDISESDSETSIGETGTPSGESDGNPFDEVCDVYSYTFPDSQSVFRQTLVQTMTTSMKIWALHLMLPRPPSRPIRVSTRLIWSFFHEIINCTMFLKRIQTILSSNFID